MSRRLIFLRNNLKRGVVRWEWFKTSSIIDSAFKIFSNMLSTIVAFLRRHSALMTFPSHRLFQYFKMDIFVIIFPTRFRCSLISYLISKKNSQFVARSNLQFLIHYIYIYTWIFSKLRIQRLYWLKISILFHRISCIFFDYAYSFSTLYSWYWH